jgi:RNA polymerase sigma-54 factor
LHISPIDVDVVRTFVQQQLWPYPTQSLLSSESAFQRPRYLLPDVEIRDQSGKFVVEVLNSPVRILRLSPLYADLARQGATLDDQARLHVHNYISRARTFLSNLRQREITLQRISEAVVAHQEEFLRHGVRHLAPLTRSEIAAEVGVHESTVSRAITDKTVLLPVGLPMPFSDFFVAARGVQDVIRELIENETTPLSDAALARMLTERGYAIARRTVAKYREQMNILPSKLR